MNTELQFTEKQIKRFWSRTSEQPNGCLLWTGCTVGGYGKVTVAGQQWRANRLGYVLKNGPIPDGLVVRHRCPSGPNPLCCNPDHLLVGTYKENSQDMIADGRLNNPRGERVANHVLTKETVSEIKAHLLAGTMSQLAIAREFGVAKSTINAIRLGESWDWLEPRIPKEIPPQPSRKFSDNDYLAIRELWRRGMKLKELAEMYKCRVDMIQAIISGKRGTNVPAGERVIRFHCNKHSDEIRKSIYQRYTEGETQLSLAAEFNYSKNGMNNLIASERNKL